MLGKDMGHEEFGDFGRRDGFVYQNEDTLFQ